MDGAPLVSIQVAQDKAYTAVGFGIPSGAWHDFIKDDPPLAAGATDGIDRLVVFAGGFILFLILLALLAPLVAPHDPLDQDLLSGTLPPAGPTGRTFSTETVDRGACSSAIPVGVLDRTGFTPCCPRPSFGTPYNFAATLTLVPAG